MDTISFLIAFAVVMWGLQILLGWRQIQRFNKEFQRVSTKGRTLIGRNNNGRFKAKVIFVLAIDEQENVIDCLYMKGFSVFAQPQSCPNLIGLKLNEIDPVALFPQDQNSRLALQSALSIS
ncbi:XRE family transcriptional regulator [Pasteurellaceae bacterium Macca]|nr:XRE family transcriptional regulator [Pasteurellaceae bacterium Macca]